MTDLFENNSQPTPAETQSKSLLGVPYYELGDTEKVLRFDWALTLALSESDIPQKFLADPNIGEAGWQAISDLIRLRFRDLWELAVIVFQLNTKPKSLYTEPFTDKAIREDGQLRPSFTRLSDSLKAMGIDRVQIRTGLGTQLFCRFCHNCYYGTSKEQRRNTKLKNKRVRDVWAGAQRGTNHEGPPNQKTVMNDIKPKSPRF